MENEEARGEMYEFAYPVTGERGVELVVATTRPETMLGDTAVAVHPDDPRHKALHGKTLTHPLVDREIPIITDPMLGAPVSRALRALASCCMPLTRTAKNTG